MRKITQLSTTAFKNNTNFNSSNTTVQVLEKHTLLRLHGHIIARKEINSNKLYLTNCGYETNTTKERLNGVLKTYGLNARIFAKNFVWYIDLNGKTKEFKSDQLNKIELDQYC